MSVKISWMRRVLRALRRKEFEEIDLLVPFAFLVLFQPEHYSASLQYFLDFAINLWVGTWVVTVARVIRALAARARKEAA